MFQATFYKRLKATRKHFEWYVEDSKLIRGNRVGYVSVLGGRYCPITAVASLHADVELSLTDSIAKLGLSRKFADSIIDGADYADAHLSEKNKRVRANIRKALGI